MTSYLPYLHAGLSKVDVGSNWRKSQLLAINGISQFSTIEPKQPFNYTELNVHLRAFCNNGMRADWAQNSEKGDQ